MEIKGVFDRYKMNTQLPVANKPSAKAEEATEKKREMPTTDTISVSSTASFQTTYSKEVKAYANAAKAELNVSEARLSALKELYKDDNCPTSSDEIASAIMHRTMLI